MNKTPNWNLDSLWTSPQSEEYKAALSQYQKDMKTIERHLEADKTNFGDWLKAALNLLNKFGALEESISAYAYSIYSTDTTNKAYLDNLSKIEEMGIESQKLDLKFETAVKENKEQLADFFASNPEYSEYKFILEEIIESASHKMSDAEENLASDLQRTGGDAWGRLQETLISSLTDKETGKTFNQLRNDAYSPDAKTRESSYRKELQLLKDNEITFASCLNNLKGETLALNKRRSWQDAIDRALASSRMTRKTLDALVSAIEESLPIWRDYLNTKAAHLYSLPQETKPGLSFFDLFAPLNAASSNSENSILSKNWTFEEAKDYIIEKYTTFSPKMGEFAKRAFESNWIDAEVKPGKVGGAYCQDFPYQKESRVLTNFTGAFSDIITLAHELGHAFHHSCITSNDYILSSYPMTLAETASTFAETIVKKDLIKNAEGSDKAELIEFDLQDACQVIVDILSRYYFERSVFKERQSGELTSEDFCRLMQEAQEKTYGSGLNENRHQYMWAVKSHYYSTGLDFYNFPYAFGQLFALGLYQRYKKEGEPFTKVYETLLSHTGKMTCEDLCKEAGFDITTKEFWLTGLSSYAAELAELKELLK